MAFSGTRHPCPPPAHGGPARASGDLTCVVGRADAHVVVDAVHAGGVVLAVVVLAVVWVDLTPLSLEAQRTGAALGTCGVGRREPGVREGGGLSGRREGWVDIISEVSLRMEVQGPTVDTHGLGVLSRKPLRRGTGQLTQPRAPSPGNAHLPGPGDSFQ